jgi:hypothetical protein
MTFSESGLAKTIGGDDRAAPKKLLRHSFQARAPV